MFSERNTYLDLLNQKLLIKSIKNITKDQSSSTNYGLLLMGRSVCRNNRGSYICRSLTPFRGPVKLNFEKVAMYSNVGDVRRQRINLFESSVKFTRRLAHTQPNRSRVKFPVLKYPTVDAISKNSRNNECGISNSARKKTYLITEAKKTTIFSTAV